MTVPTSRPAPEALRSALARLDLRLQLAVESQRAELAERARDPFRGLYISEADVDQLLAPDRLDELVQRLLGGPAGDMLPRLGRLATLFALDDFDQDALLIC